jgi:uncharacterized protein YdhG (YjbR/CyaY superfamily)
MNTKINTPTEYIKGLPTKDKKGFKELHDLIVKAVPNAEQGISYGMPCLKMNGMLLYYACHSAHYSLYPFSATIVAFKERLTDYVTSKGTIQFPHDKPLPKKLITDIVKYRYKEKIALDEAKKANKAGKVKKGKEA